MALMLCNLCAAPVFASGADSSAAGALQAEVPEEDAGPASDSEEDSGGGEPAGPPPRQETNPPQAPLTIVRFAPLALQPQYPEWIEVPYGTEAADIPFPASLWAIALQDGAEVDVEIPVSEWRCAGYDPCAYYTSHLFNAVFDTDAYVVQPGVYVPSIKVAVAEEPYKMMVDFTPLAEEAANIEVMPGTALATIKAMLPRQLEALVVYSDAPEGTQAVPEVIQLSGWTTGTPAYDPETPGEYLLNPVIPRTGADGVKLERSLKDGAYNPVITLTVADISAGVMGTVACDGSWYAPDATSYEIASLAQLAYFVKLANGIDTPDGAKETFAGKTIRLTADIDLTGQDLDGDESNGNWLPVELFSGHFDGGGHVIRGMTVRDPRNNYSTKNYRGLFAQLKDATVSNLGVVEGEIYFNAYGSGCKPFLGLLAGQATDSTIRKVFTTGSVTVEAGNANPNKKVGATGQGGVVGFLYGGVLSDAYSDVSLLGDVQGSYVGGIAGEVAYSPAEVNDVGFVLRANDVLLQNCYAIGSVAFGDHRGGIAGYYSGGTFGKATLKNCVAANIRVQADNTFVHNRVVYAGTINPATTIFSGLHAWKTMPGGSWDNRYRTTTEKDGADVPAERLRLAATWKSIFGAGNTSWQCADGALPILNGFAGDAQTGAFPAWLHDGWSDTGSRGSGTKADPFLIENEEQLRALSQKVADGFSYSGTYFRLAQDLALAEPFMPIGNTRFRMFMGHFDGGGHVIKNLTWHDDAEYSGAVGLFGYVQNASVRNLGLVNVNLSTTYRAGGVAGEGYNVTIENCFVTGSISGRGTLGGILGYGQGGGLNTNDGTLIIQNCYTDVSFTLAEGASGGGGRSVGGIVAYAEGKGSIKNCYAAGSVAAGPGVVPTLGVMPTLAGIAGFAGLSGYVENCVALMRDFTAANDYPAAFRIGRDVVYAATNFGDPAYSKMRNNYGFAYSSFNGAPRQWFPAAKTSAQGADATAAQMGAASWWKGIFGDGGQWVFANGQLPMLAGFETYAQSGAMPGWLVDGEPMPAIAGAGTAANPYRITSETQLQALSRASTNGQAFKDLYFKLEADIDLKQPIKPIGTVETPFRGVFDGAGHIISNLRLLPVTGEDALGLFGSTLGATIKNLGVEIDATAGSFDALGGIAGSALDTVITGCHVTGVLRGAGTGYSAVVGGIAGKMFYTTLTHCYADIEVRMNGTGTVGGIAGAVSDDFGGGNLQDKIENCYAILDVTLDLEPPGDSRPDLATPGYVGGILGHLGYVEWGTLSASLKNNVALLNNISCDAEVMEAGRRQIGRVATASSTRETVLTLAGNHGFAGATVNGDSRPWSDSATGADGKDLSAATVMTPAFWQGLGFTAAKGWATAPRNLPRLSAFGGKGPLLDAYAFLRPQAASFRFEVQNKPGQASVAYAYSARARTVTLELRNEYEEGWFGGDVAWRVNGLEAGQLAAPTYPNNNSELRKLTIPAKFSGVITATVTYGEVSLPLEIRVGGDVTALKLTPKTEVLAIGSTLQLTHTLTPATAADKRVEYRISRAVGPDGENSGEVAVIDPETGALKALAEGEVTVTATALGAAGGAVVADTCTVTLAAPVESIAFNREAVLLELTGQPTAMDELAIVETTPAPGYEGMKPALRSQKWASSSTSVIKVDAATGRLTPVKLGQANITATWVDGAGAAFTDSFSVHVLAPVDNLSIKLSTTAKALNTGQSYTIKPSYTPSAIALQTAEWVVLDGTNGTENTQKLHAAAAPATGGAARVADVDSITGKVTAVCPGTVTVELRVRHLLHRPGDEGYNAVARCAITVNRPVQSAALSENALTLTPAAYEDLSRGEQGLLSSAKLSLDILPQDAAFQQGLEANATGKITWSSSNKSLVTVDENGNLRVVGGKSGSATITAKAGGKSASCKVSVVVPVACGGGGAGSGGVVLKQDYAALEWKAGATRTLAAWVRSAPQLAGTAGAPAPTNKKLTWASGDPSIATVSASGAVKALRPGEVSIRVTSQDDARAWDEVLLTVTAPVTAIKFNQPAFTVKYSDNPKNPAAVPLSVTLNGGAPTTRWMSNITLSVPAGTAALYFRDENGEPSSSMTYNPMAASATDLPVLYVGGESTLGGKDSLTIKVTATTMPREETGCAAKSATLKITVARRTAQASSFNFSNYAKAPGMRTANAPNLELAVGKAFRPDIGVGPKSATNKGICWTISASDGGDPLRFVDFNAATGELRGNKASAGVSLSVEAALADPAENVTPQARYEYSFRVVKAADRVVITPEEAGRNTVRARYGGLAAEDSQMRLYAKLDGDVGVGDVSWTASGGNRVRLEPFVDGQGRMGVTVTGLNAGAVTITATANDSVKKKAAYAIKVEAPVLNVVVGNPKVAATPSPENEMGRVELNMGGKYTFTGKLNVTTDTAGKALAPSPGNKTVMWRVVEERGHDGASKPGGVITLNANTGAVKAIGGGYAVVQAYSPELGEGEGRYPANLEVYSATGARKAVYSNQVKVVVSVPATGVTLNQKGLNLASGRQVKLSATTAPLLAGLTTGQDELTWTISNTGGLRFAGIAANNPALTASGKTLSYTGAGATGMAFEAQPLAAGTSLAVKVTVKTASGKSAAITITVHGTPDSAAAVDRIVLNKNTSWLRVGQSETLKATLTGKMNAAGTKALKPGNTNLIWEIEEFMPAGSAEPAAPGSVAVVDQKGKVTVKGFGYARVTVRPVDDEFATPAVCWINCMAA